MNHIRSFMQVIVDGMNFQVRVNELSTWTPSIKRNDDEEDVANQGNGGAGLEEPHECKHVDESEIDGKFTGNSDEGDVDRKYQSWANLVENEVTCRLSPNPLGFEGYYYGEQHVLTE
ncbi:hypothetical protein L1887_26735 [Cichorium endivia]|nr:hypothetical protein L1887_26735 [Cichorium endivia]